MSATAIETALMLHVEQITDGDAQCQFCGEAAVVTMGNGADPDLEPQCAEHAILWLRQVEDFMRRWKPKGE